MPKIPSFLKSTYSITWPIFRDSFKDCNLYCALNILYVQPVEPHCKSTPCHESPYALRWWCKKWKSVVVGFYTEQIKNVTSVSLRISQLISEINFTLIWQPIKTISMFPTWECQTWNAISNLWCSNVSKSST